MGEQSVNIIYITNNCDIDCSYCYQREERQNSKKFIIDDSKIIESINNIVINEPGVVSTLVLFGGEPFLYSEKLFFACDEVKKVKKLFNKEIAISCVTNGMWLYNKNNLNKFINYINNSDLFFQLEISYDGENSFRRIDKKGCCINSKIIQVFENLIQENFKFAIRYTVNKDNYLHCVKDISKLILKYGSKNISKITLSFFNEELSDLVNLFSFKKELSEKFNYLYTKLGIPICEMSCGACKECNVGIMKNIKYYNNEDKKTILPFTLKKFEF